MAELISIEPATGAEFWRGPVGDPAAEVAAARAGWIGWGARPLAVRSETLRRFANLVRRNAASLADGIAREVGKPLWEADAETDAVVARVDAAIAAQGERSPTRRMEGALSSRVAVRHRPHGVLGVITAYPSPLLIPTGHLVPALLAGNAVVLKPSEKAPGCALRLVALLHEAGVPEEALRVVVGGPEEGAALARNADLDGLLFTGSSAVGGVLHHAFGVAPSRLLALECGGNNPLIAWGGADLDAAAAIIVQSAFQTAGQRCTATRRLIVEDGRHQPLVDAIGRLMDRLIVGAPHDKPQPYLGALIDDEAATRVQDGFLDLIMKGGLAVRHVGRVERERPFLTPGLIDVTAVHGRADLEIFGPMLQMVRVPDFDTAIAEANATRFGLAATLVGGSPEQYDHFWANARAGIVNWNRPANALPPSVPMGGIGASGNLRPGMSYAADYCARPVTSAEADMARATIGVGVREA